MKRILLIALLITSSFAMGLNAQSQFGKHLDLNVYGGYSWGDYYSGYNAELRLSANGFWGAALSLDVQSGIKGEFHYQHFRPTLSIRPYVGSGLTKDQIEVASNWFLIGSLAEKKLSKPFSIFGYMGIGAAYTVPISSSTGIINSYTSSWAFAVALQGGFKYWISDKIGIRGFMALNIPMQFGGVGFYVGGGGSGLSLNSYSSMFLFNMGGGLMFRMF